MLSIITKAAENFCEHQIRKPYLLNTTVPKMRMLIASIEIVQNEKSHTVYVAITKELVQNICEIFLFEDESDEDTLQDMLLETTNMIVGSAKVLAQDEVDIKGFNIKTPLFLETKRFDYSCDEMSRISLKNGSILLAIKE